MTLILFIRIHNNIFTHFSINSLETRIFIVIMKFLNNRIHELKLIFGADFFIFNFYVLETWNTAQSEMFEFLIF